MFPLAQNTKVDLKIISVFILHEDGSKTEITEQFKEGVVNDKSIKQS